MSFPTVRPGDHVVLTATNDKRLAVGSRGVVERVVEGVDRKRGNFVCVHVRWESGEVAGLVSTLNDEFEVLPS